MNEHFKIKGMQMEFEEKRRLHMVEIEALRRYLRELTNPCLDPYEMNAEQIKLAAAALGCAFDRLHQVTDRVAALVTEIGK